MDIGYWLDDYSVNIASETANEYGEYTYTPTVIKARLVLVEHETYNTAGELKVCRAKLFTETELTLNTLIGIYKVVSAKAVNDKENTIVFYRYSLE